MPCGSTRTFASTAGPKASATRPAAYRDGQTIASAASNAAVAAAKRSSMKSPMPPADVLLAKLLPRRHETHTASEARAALRPQGSSCGPVIML